MATLLRDCLPADPDPSPDDLLGRFLDYVDEVGLSLYPAQEEAVPGRSSIRLYRGSAPAQRSSPVAAMPRSE